MQKVNAIKELCSELHIKRDLKWSSSERDNCHEISIWIS